MKIKHLIVSSLLFIVMIFSSVSIYANNTSRKILLRIGYIPLLPQLPLIVANDRDRFNYKNIKTKLFRYSSFTSIEAAIRVNAVDVASIPIPIALSMAADGIPIKIIGAFQHGGTLLVSKNTADINTLKGKVIGVPGLDSNEHIQLMETLSANSFRYGFDYTTIAIPFDSALANFKADRVNALYLPEPYGSMAIGEANGVAVAVPAPNNCQTGNVIVVRTDFLKTGKSIAIDEWLKSIIRSCRFLENDIDYFSARQTAIIQKTSFGYSEVLVTSSLKERRGGIRFAVHMPTVNTFSEYNRKLIELKMTRSTIDLNTLLDVSLLERAMKSAREK